MFYIAKEEDIRKGKVTDIYFKRTEEILKAKNIDVSVKAEVFLKGFPLDRWLSTEIAVLLYFIEAVARVSQFAKFDELVPYRLWITIRRPNRRNAGPSALIAGAMPQTGLIVKPRQFEPLLKRLHCSPEILRSHHIFG